MLHKPIAQEKLSVTPWVCNALGPRAYKQGAWTMNAVVIVLASCVEIHGKPIGMNVTQVIPFRGR